MSCHNIGKGMNEVVKKIVGMYDKEELSLETAKELIIVARKSVHCCDGNEDEATDFIRMHRCGKCLKKKGEAEMFYSVKDISEDKIGKNDIMDDSAEALASDALCQPCFDDVINRWFNDDKAGERERRFIEQCIQERKQPGR